MKKFILLSILLGLVYLDVAYYNIHRKSAIEFGYDGIIAVFCLSLIFFSSFKSKN